MNNFITLTLNGLNKCHSFQAALSDQKLVSQGLFLEKLFQLEIISLMEEVPEILPHLPGYNCHIILK